LAEEEAEMAMGATVALVLIMGAEAAEVILEQVVKGILEAVEEEDSDLKEETATLLVEVAEVDMDQLVTEAMEARLAVLQQVEAVKLMLVQTALLQKGEQEFAFFIINA
jgi:hypothetical protein